MNFLGSVVLCFTRTGTMILLKLQSGFILLYPEVRSIASSTPRYAEAKSGDMRTTAIVYSDYLRQCKIDV